MFCRFHVGFQAVQYLVTTNFTLNRWLPYSGPSHGTSKVHLEIESQWWQPRSVHKIPQTSITKFDIHVLMCAIPHFQWFSMCVFALFSRMRWKSSMRIPCFVASAVPLILCTWIETIGLPRPSLWQDVHPPHLYIGAKYSTSVSLFHSFPAIEMWVNPFLRDLESMITASFKALSKHRVKFAMDFPPYFDAFPPFSHQNSQHFGAQQKQFPTIFDVFALWIPRFPERFQVNPWLNFTSTLLANLLAWFTGWFPYIIYNIQYDIVIYIYTYYIHIYIYYYILYYILLYFILYIIYIIYYILYIIYYICYIWCSILRNYIILIHIAGFQWWLQCSSIIIHFKVRFQGFKLLTVHFQARRNYLVTSLIHLLIISGWCKFTMPCCNHPGMNPVDDKKWSLKPPAGK